MNFSIFEKFRLSLLITILLASGALAAAPFSEEDVSFMSGELTLHGTLLVPQGANNTPGIVMVHGSGVGIRQYFRAEGEIFAAAGITTLIYDKRTVGYSGSRIGKRSYSLLAEDVLAAIQYLQSRQEINTTQIGLWGLSEGGWVAPLAASQSDDIAFLITVGGSGLAPIQTQLWNMENRLRDRGLQSDSLISAITEPGQKLLISAHLFPEATYDPIVVLQKIKQPILAIWGENDRQVPPVESAELFKKTLEQSGNHRWTMQFIPNGNHVVHFSPDGFRQTDDFAPGYDEGMTSWVTKVLDGQAPQKVVLGTESPQARQSPAGNLSPGWANSAWLHIGGGLLLAIGFITKFVRSFTKAGTGLYPGLPERLKRIGERVVSAGSASAIVGFYILYGYLMMTGGNQSLWLLNSTPMPWILLQGLAWIIVLVFIALMMSYAYAGIGSFTGQKVRQYLLFIVGVVCFIAWSFYWHLLTI